MLQATDVIVVLAGPQTSAAVTDLVNWGRSEEGLEFSYWKGAWRCGPMEVPELTYSVLGGGLTKCSDDWNKLVHPPYPVEFDLPEEATIAEVIERIREFGGRRAPIHCWAMIVAERLGDGYQPGLDAATGWRHFNEAGGPGWPRGIEEEP